MGKRMKKGRGRYSSARASREKERSSELEGEMETNSSGRALQLQWLPGLLQDLAEKYWISSSSKEREGKDHF